MPASFSISRARDPENSVFRNLHLSSQNIDYSETPVYRAIVLGRGLDRDTAHSNMKELGRCILIADDDAEIREMVRRVAAAEGLHVIEASNAAEAQALALERQPALVVLDIAFPGEDGRDILARLKADPKTAQIPVLVWSGGDAESARRIALNLGAEDFVEKATAQTLLNKIKRLFLRLEEK